jgi:hypothetical protein
MPPLPHSSDPLRLHAIKEQRYCHGDLLKRIRSHAELHEPIRPIPGGYTYLQSVDVVTPGRWNTKYLAYIPRLPADSSPFTGVRGACGMTGDALFEFRFRNQLNGLRSTEPSLSRVLSWDSEATMR